LDEPVPPSLSATPCTLHVWFRRYAALFVVAVFAGAGGWYLHEMAQSASLAWHTEADTDTKPESVTELARQAVLAYVIYTADSGHPVEIGAEQGDVLENWLSGRIGADVRAPELGTHGYALIGGRLLPGHSGPVAQFMYHDQRDQKLTLYISTEQVQYRDSGFHFMHAMGVDVFYWIDGQFTYAISGSIGKDALARLASAVYQQTNRLVRGAVIDRTGW